MIFESFVSFLKKVFFFTAYVNSKGSFPEPLNAADEKKYLLAAKAGDKSAREMLIRHNLRLVAHIVKKYSNAGEADDLISVGSIGLIKGIETFELGKGSQLATYAAKCIDNEILMYIRSNKKHRQSISLSESVGVDKDGNEITLMDIIPLKEESIFKQVETGIVWEKVLVVIDTALTKREKEIIKKRYGIGGIKPQTQLEVANEMDISRSYVSRIEKKAILKISKAVTQPKK
ncbi:MAG: RNA polymerase sporulation sigma factor SigK [Firmicutes bacterium]|nr:RNA polymerase sporulation sigma factor SigK [Bacillota bacterium]